MIGNNGTASDVSVYRIGADIESAGKAVELDQLLSLSQDLFCCLSSDGQLLYVNNSWTKFLGYAEDAIKQTSLPGITVDEDTPLALELLELAERAEASGMTIRLLCCDGSSRSFEWSARRSGDVIYAIGRAVAEYSSPSQRAGDTPEYSKSESEPPGPPASFASMDGIGQRKPDFGQGFSSMLTGSDYLRTILEKTQDAFFANSYNTIIDANEAFFRMTGYRREDLPHIGFEDFVAEESINQLYERLPLLFAQGNDRFEGVNKKRDGSKFAVEVSTCVINVDPPITVCFMRDITGRKKSEKKVLHAHELMRYIIEHNRIAVAVHDKDLNYMYVSRPYIEFFGLEGREIIGKHHYEIMPTLPQKWKDVHRRVLCGEVISSGDTESVMNKGAMVIWECRPWYEEDGSVGGLILYIEDITARKQIEKMLFDEKEHFRTTLLSVGEGVISTDNQGLVTVMNPVAERLTGWTLEEAAGKQLDDVLHIVNDQTDIEVTAQMMQIPATGMAVEYGDSQLVVSKTGNTVAAEINVSPIRNKDETVGGAVIIINDFTEKRQKQRQIEYLSYHDALTGLFNRRYMEDIMALLNRTGCLPLTLMVVDVNGLKLTNDAFGHETGDQLLKTVARALKAVCRPADILGRMGGDEFLLILPDTGSDKASELKQQILLESSGLKMENVIVSLAVGYAVKSLPAQELKAVMTAADNQMYQDKVRFGKAMRSQTIQTVVTNINLRYKREQIHTERVSYFCEAIAIAMDMSDKEVQDIKTAGAFHDIGKIMVPPELLDKPSRLTREEFELVKRHPEIGYQMLKPVDEYAHLAEYVLYHHERWDGNGYPIGLAGERIPLYSRIIAVADAFEAMTAERPYQATKSKEEAAAELRRCAGTQFDPKIVELFTNNILRMV